MPNCLISPLRAVTLALSLLLASGCTPNTAATHALNPIDLCRMAGAEPDMGNEIVKYLKLDDGSQLGHCIFKDQALPINSSVGAFTSLAVYTYNSRMSLSEALSSNPNATPTMIHKVIVGKDQNFYAILTGLADGTFDVKPEDVAASLNGTLLP
jgi:hypothetical protein